MKSNVRYITFPFLENMTQTIKYESEAEWLADNPLYRYRFAEGQKLPAPVDDQTKERPAVPQDDVAEVVGVTGMAVSQWENGKFMPKYQHLITLAPLLSYANADDLYKFWLAWRQSKPVQAQETA